MLLDNKPTMYWDYFLLLTVTLILQPTEAGAEPLMGERTNFIKIESPKEFQSINFENGKLLSFPKTIKHEQMMILSIRKRAFQSSTASPLGSADHAIDGSLKSNFSKGSCIQTLKESNPWWMVDLGSICLVGSVVVTNREDCCHEEINGALILIGDSRFGGGISNPSCKTISSLGPGETKSFSCGMMKGRYVTITIPGFNRVLSLCEVQVFGHQLRSSNASNSSTESNSKGTYIVEVSKNKKTFQSSTLNKFGVPGEIYNKSLTNDLKLESCIETQKEKDPWWMVDLQSTYPIEYVSVTGRRDCCRYEMDRALILVGNSQENGGKSNMRCAVIPTLAPGKKQFFQCKGMKGQFVTLTVPGLRKTLTMCEVQVFAKMSDAELKNQLNMTENTTQHQPAGPGETQKVQTSQSTVFIPSRFPDKPMDGSSQSGHCVQTLQENAPWWMADLHSTQIVDSVSITNRKDCCHEQINGVIILVGDLPDQNGKLNARCATVPSLGPGMTWVFKCGRMKGRYVTITNPGRIKVLSFCNVQIFGKPWDSNSSNLATSSGDFYPLLSLSGDVPETPRNDNSSAISYNFDLSENNFAPVLSKGKSAFQSSISTPSGSPERAVDGSLLSDFEKGTCIQTKQEINPWWMVDLGSTETVKSVAITTRKDCCTEELRGALILVGDSPDEGGMSNTRCAVIGSLGHEKTEFFRCGMMRGRYVSVVNPKRRTFLSFCEVRVFGKTSESISPGLPSPSPESWPSSPNAGDGTDLTGPVLSKQRPTFQSSVFITSQFPETETPMDGSVHSGYCVRTLQENDPWWMIDLGSTQTLGSVSITIQKDCCPEQIQGSLILVGDSPDQGGKLNSRCATIPSLDPGIKYVFSCEKMYGRYVTITKPGRKKVLSFCDVKVFGKTWKSEDNVFHNSSLSTSSDDQQKISHSSYGSYNNFDHTENNLGPVLSKQRPTFQSSVFIPSQFPEKPMDGSVHSGYCVRTLQENDPWWMVDLGSTQTLGSVSITNRKDCCPEQIQGSLILVGDSPDQGGKWNFRCATIPSLGLGIKHVFSCEEMNGRYVTITKPGREKVLSFCDVKVFGKTWNSENSVFHYSSLSTSGDDQQINSHSFYGSYYNFDLTENNFSPVLSKGKPAFQSSISSPSGSPKRAVDGSLLSDFEKDTCIQTLREINPWWMVDLGSTEIVKSVAITPRKDCCTEELRGALILVGDSPYDGGTLNARCAVIGSLGYGKAEFFRCGMIRGRYVSVVNPKRGTFLSFCEVRVFGKASSSISPGVPLARPESWPLLPKDSDDTSFLGPVLSKQRPTFQSSVFIPSQFPEKSMDGSVHSGYCVRTLQENDPWWMIDLGSTQTLGSVSITNRKDCCAEQIQGSLILVGDSPDQGGKWNFRCAIIPSLDLGIKHAFSCDEMSGRYVTITKPGREKVLSFCDVKVFGKTWKSENNVFQDSSLSTSGDDQQTTSHGSYGSYYNFDLTENNFAPVLSKGKYAFQSSIASPFGSPERAVDGSLLDDFEKGTCIHTQREINPWWMVDLGSTETVKSVAITPRKDCCTEELHGALILVGDSPIIGGLFNARCAVIGSLDHGKTEFSSCGMMRGRYVSIVNPKRGTFLSFCEVRVFGKAPDSISAGVPLANPESWLSSPKASDDTSLHGLLQIKGLQTFQSSIFIPHQFPDKLMDESIQSGHCIQTLQENDPWWMTDLGSTQTVDSVSITNRKDCCKEQINGAMILVGDSPDQGGKFNARCAIIIHLGLGAKRVFSCGAMNGRYVTIIHPGREKVLSFCDVKVFVKTWNSENKAFSDTSYTLLPASVDDQEISRNHKSPKRPYAYEIKNNFTPLLSRGKSAFQSSISTPFGSPERAVDGSLVSDFEKGSCIQTLRENNPWWMVDLGSTQTVESVAITTRKDCCAEELHGALILVGDSLDNGGAFNSRCAVIGFLGHGKTEFFKCGTLHGRYVSIFNPGREKMISLCEVQVLGKAADSLPPGRSAGPESWPLSPKASDDMDLTGLKQPKGAQTFQSSIFIPHQFPDKLMDGSIQSDYCVQTLQENDPWWMVDLGSTQTIDSVSITNRKDCCKEQINGTIILVGDSPDQGGKFNARCIMVPSLDQGVTHIFNCGKMKGRYVTITHLGKQKVLSFCDMKIFGKTWGLFSFANKDQQKTRSAGSSVTSYNFDNTDNNFSPVLSKGKPAFQSSISTPSGSPERAVDGSLLGDFEKGTCIQTHQEDNPWWVVDLGSTQTVKSVAITPRKDCCTEELGGALILVGDSPIQGGTLNARCAVIGFLSHEKSETFTCGMIRGRYVSIFNPGREKMISLCEVRVFGKTSDSLLPGHMSFSSKSRPLSSQAGNAMGSTAPLVSRGKPAFQSSIFNPLGSPERAVDGFLFSDFNKSSCMQTYPENDPWWMVDLGSVYTVESVSITSRRDCCSELMNGAMILVGDSQYLGGRLNPRCAVVPAMGPGKTEFFSCGSMKGRFVIVTIPGTGKILTMCEVQVFGKALKSHNPTVRDPWEQITDSVILLSRGKTAFQSSVSYLSASPERALAMSFQSDFGKSSCIQTLQETNPWWMVDLGSTYSVVFVSLTNRDDCCQEQVNGAMILVGDSPHQGGNFNPKCAIISSMPPRKTAFFSCGAMTGRYVTIIIPGREKVLTLCKVEIFGSNDSQQFIPPQMDWLSLSSSFPEIMFASNPRQNSLAQISLKQKPVSQSSISNPSGSPERAVDDSLETDFRRGSCIQTHQETDPWWMIDLESTQSVEYVAITNRRDCCHEQINGAAILIGDSSDHGGKSNPRCATIFSLGPGKTESFNCGSLRGRYVTITIPGRRKLLTFCEVQVFIKMTQPLPGIQPSYPNTLRKLPPTSNKAISAPLGSGALPTSDGRKNIRPCAPLLSQGMSVFQSSTSSLFGSPERAIDGSLASDFSEGSCIQTLSEYEPWWMVDLGSSYVVDYVAITNRKDCCHEQINGAVILVGDSSASGGRFNPSCATISSLDPGRTESFFCGSMNGRYVTVTIPGKKKFLTFCEVQVFGKLTPLLPHILPKTLNDLHRSIGVNIALGKISYQSSTFHPLGSSDKAIDGNEASDFYKNSCTHTNDDFEPWWMVDLTAEFIVDNIMIIPRGDRCMGMTAKYEIRIGDSKENGGKSNSRCGDKARISPGQKHIFKCDGIKGRFITVTMPEVKEFLSLCEVEVFGKQVIKSG
ncbi:uncharacterized protein [Notamacropus eugenii]|uniref:uncharacterized protein n=1 Tax=Notamacropus eugenii TaxID=9315 RepID=UPI003B6765B3